MWHAPLIFSAAAWSLPKEEVANYFIWKQRVAERESILAFCSHFAPDYEGRGVDTATLKNRLLKKYNINWEDEPEFIKHGASIIKENGAPYVDNNVPLFLNDRYYIDRFVGDSL
jgi:tRNA(His) 5'-end guanylyltransferase